MESFHDVSPGILSCFQVIQVPSKAVIVEQGARLDQLYGLGSCGDYGAPLQDLFLDFIAKGSVQLVRKSCFVSSPPFISAQGGREARRSDPQGWEGKEKESGANGSVQAHETPLYKHLPLIEFAEGDCYTALDIYGGQDHWTCSAVAISEVEVLRINLREFCNLIAPQVACYIKGGQTGFCL